MIKKQRNQKSLNLLFLEGEKMSYKKGELIQDTSDNDPQVMLLVSGFIKRYAILNDGTENIQVVYGTGDIFPLTTILGKLFDQQLYYGPETFYYQTMSQVEVRVFDIQVLCDTIEKSPRLYSDLLKVAGKRLRSNIQRLENIARRDAYSRVAHQLLYYSRIFSEANSRGVTITVPLTHQELANVLSLTRETVSREIGTLKTQNIIKINKNHQFVVTDLNKLEEAAYS